jgi:hypothetical protein
MFPKAISFVPSEQAMANSSTSKRFPAMST